MTNLPILAMLHPGDGDFSWTSFSVHPSVLIGCSIMLGLYFYGIGPLRKKMGWTERATGTQVACFTAGVLIMFGALNGPIHDLSDYYLFSAHMVQHLLLTLIMAPLLLVGLPAFLVRPLLKYRAVYATARALTSPIVGFAVYNAVMVGWHLPQFYNWALEDHNVHIVQHLMFIASAVMVWWPVADPVPELSRFPTPMRMLFLFALGIPMAVISALITLAAAPLYTFYEAAPRVFEGISALDDQQIGGLIMWVPGMMVYWAAITIIFFRWSRGEAREDAREQQVVGSTA